MANILANGKVKIAIAAVVLLGAITFVYAQYKRVKPDMGGPPRRGEMRPGGQQSGDKPPMDPRNISKEERVKMRNEVLDKLNLTAEQKTKIDEINKKYDAEKDSPQTMMNRMKDIRALLTPEQQKEAEKTMMGGIRGRMEDRLKMLPADQKQKFMEKLEKRMQERRNDVKRRLDGGGGKDGGGGDMPPGPPPDMP